MKLGLWRFYNLYFKISGGYNLKHFKIVWASYFAMFNHWSLQNGITFANCMLSVTFIFKSGPTIQNIHRLEITLMNMPWLDTVIIFVFVTANYISYIITICRSLNPKSRYSKILQRPPTHFASLSSWCTKLHFLFFFIKPIRVLFIKKIF